MTGTPFRVVRDAVLEVETFDNGGEGVAYHDADSRNLGGNNYRPKTGVDVETSSNGGRDVTSFRAGEWLEYTVNVITPGTYTLTARLAALKSGGQFHVEVDGVNRSGTFNVSRTGGTQKWAAVSKGIALTAGTHVLRVKADRAGSNGLVANLDSLKFTLPPPLISAPKFSVQRGVPADGDHVGFLAEGDWVGYRSVDFGRGATQFQAQVAAPKGFAGQRIQVRLGSSTGKVIGTLVVKRTKSWDTYSWQSTKIKKVRGIHDVYLTFVGANVGNIRALRFV
jgi:hypothetical protein